MAKKITAYQDGQGNLHNTADAATIADIIRLFGDSEGMATGIARTVFANRKELEKIFREHDATVGAPMSVVPSVAGHGVA